jgi:hypothetical protein
MPYSDPSQVPVRRTWNIHARHPSDNPYFRNAEIRT